MGNYNTTETTVDHEYLCILLQAAWQHVRAAQCGALHPPLPQDQELCGQSHSSEAPQPAQQAQNHTGKLGTVPIWPITGTYL